MSDLHIEYRPTCLNEVVGQDAAVESIRKLHDKGNMPHAYLFCGESGVGKTTLARIIGSLLGAEVREFDAATNSSVQDVRAIIAATAFKSLECDSKLYIIDECHSLSKQAWQAFLKTIEEPPEHSYFAFCTTEDKKVPKTVRTRCHTYPLRPIPTDIIEDYLEDTVQQAGVSVSKDGVRLIAKEAYGSMRQALVYLSMCDGAKTLDEVSAILTAPGATPEIIDLCRSVMKRERLDTVVGILKELDALGMEPESIRIILMGYMKSVFLNSNGKKTDVLQIMSCFSRRCDGPDGMAQLCLNLGDLYHG